jgi:hypothetical protein
LYPIGSSNSSSGAAAAEIVEWITTTRHAVAAADGAQARLATRTRRFGSSFPSSQSEKTIVGGREKMTGAVLLPVVGP